MPSPSILRLLSAALFSALLACNLNTALAQSISHGLEPEVPLRGELRKGEIHSYHITIAPEQFLHVEIKGPLGVPVILKLIAPGGQRVAEVDLRASPFQIARIFFVAQIGGQYRLEFSLDKIYAKPYEIRTVALRAATEEDRTRYAAQQLHAEVAEAVHGVPAVIRKATEKLGGLLRLHRDLADHRGEAETLYLGCLLHSQLEELNEAVDYLDKTLPLARELGDRRAEARTLTDLSDLYIGLGEPQKAAEYGEQALSLWRDLGDTEYEALTLHNHSALFRKEGEWQRALEYQRRALALWRGSGGSEAYALLGMGHWHRAVGEPEKALDYYTQALAIWEGLNNDSRFMRAVAHNYIGDIYISQGERQEALEHFNHALELSRAAETPYLEGVSLRNLAHAYAKSSEFQKALEHYDQALPKIRAAGRRHDNSDLLHNISELYFSLGDFEKAEANLTEALSIRRSINNRAGEAETLSGLARVERARGNLAAARANAENALSIIESLRGKIISPDSRASFLASHQDPYKLYIDILMQLHKREPKGGYAAMALTASERARARSLVESLGESRAELREGVEEPLLARERSLQQRLNAKAERLTQILSKEHTERQAATARKELENVLAEFQEVQDEIRARSPRYAALTQPRALTAQEIQTSLLDPDTLLLEYSLGEERSYLWAITQTSADAYELPARSEVEAAARRVYELLTARNRKVKDETADQRLSRVRAADAQFAEAAGRLTHIILPPALLHLKAKRLVVVSEGALQYVPFAALPAPREEGTEVNRPRRGVSETNAQPLVAEHEIVNLPSASTLAVLRQERGRRRAGAKTLAILADPVFENNDPRFKQNPTAAKNVIPRPEIAVRSTLSSVIERSARESGVEKLERLYFSSREAETIASFAPESQRLKAVGFLANKTNAMSPELSGYRVLHFATHGLINTQHPELSGIVLSLVDERGQPIDGFLRLHEIYNLRLNADLVVLSACQTALGKEIRGEGLVGITRGFMYAGSPRVVASLWKVDDRATAELMSIFYRAMLEEKLTPLAALKRAQKELSKRWPSPYYWAGFTIQGEWR